MTRRIRLLQNIRKFHIDELFRMRASDPNYFKHGDIVWKLTRRLKGKKKKVKIEQLSMIHEMCTNFYPDHYND